MRAWSYTRARRALPGAQIAPNRAPRSHPTAPTCPFEGPETAPPTAPAGPVPRTAGALRYPTHRPPNRPATADRQIRAPAAPTSRGIGGADRGEGGITGTIIGADDSGRAPATDKPNLPNRGARAGGCSPRFQTARAREWRDPSDREKRDIVLAGVLPASPAVSSLPAGHAQALTRPQDARFRH